MSDKEVEQLDNLLKALNKQLTKVAETLEEISKWAESEHRQECFDIVCKHQDALLKGSEQVIEKLRSLGALT